MSKARGYYEKFLVIDCETSGLLQGDNQAVNSKTGEYCQALSIGLIVVNSKTLLPIEELYVEIEWDGKSQWHERAQQVHGLTKQYLAENGIPRSSAVELIGNLILNHFGPTTAIVVAGHNPHFDVFFLKELMRSEGIELLFSNRLIDTNSVGFTIYQTYNSDDLFEVIGLEKRRDHNALDDARSALQVLQTTRLIANECFGG